MKLHFLFLLDRRNVKWFFLSLYLSFPRYSQLNDYRDFFYISSIESLGGFQNNWETRSIWLEKKVNWGQLERDFWSILWKLHNWTWFFDYFSLDLLQISLIQHGIVDRIARMYLRDIFTLSLSLSFLLLSF